MTMSKILLTILFPLLCASAHCQTLAEWTQQKKTKIQYLLDQIAANKVFINYVEKGYSIAKLGLTAIQDIKSGDFNLHRDFFHSLEIVNPSIKSYTRVADIIACQVRIVKDISAMIRDITASGQFNVAELDKIKLVFQNLLNECLENADEFYLVITPGELQMSEIERIKRIDQIYSKMKDNYSFCKSFDNECLVLATQRLNEVFEIKVGKQLNGVK
jgi:hypothetical protein